MSRIPRSFSFFIVVLFCVLALCLAPSWAEDKDASNYPLSGKVLSSSAKGAHAYQIATDSRIYLMMCEKVKGFHMGMPECKAGDKPIAAGDAVQFRVDGDWAYMPAAKGAEEGFRILTTELKVIPPLPPPPAGDSGKSLSPGDERGMVIGTGMHIRGQRQVGWSTNPASLGRPGFYPAAPAPGMAMATPGAPVMPIGPVLATPVTGGPPVLVMPAGPVSGGIVTGVSTSGGLVTGIATGPVMGTPIGGPPMGGARAGGAAMGGGGPPPWVHLLRIQAGEKIYQLECSVKPCEVDKNPIELGDTLVIRVEKKWAYLSSGPESAAKEQKLRILSETEDDATPEPLKPSAR
jgi:hypothetical protein